MRLQEIRCPLLMNKLCLSNSNPLQAFISNFEIFNAMFFPFETFIDRIEMICYAMFLVSFLLKCVETDSAEPFE